MSVYCIDVGDGQDLSRQLHAACRQLETHCRHVTSQSSSLVDDVHVATHPHSTHPANDTQVALSCHNFMRAIAIIFALADRLKIQH